MFHAAKEKSKENAKVYPGFSKRTEEGVSIYKVAGELSAGGTNRTPQAQVGERPRGGFQVGGYRGFKVFYNRRYFLNFRRYLKNEAEGRKGSRGRKLLKSSILWTKNVLQRLQNIKCF